MYFQQVSGRTTAYMENSSFVNFCGKRKAAQAKNNFIVRHPLIFFFFLFLSSLAECLSDIWTDNHS